MDGLHGIEQNLSRPSWSRPGVVFAVASLVLLTAFLIPFSEKALDILWVCSFCLSVAVTIICGAARSSSDLIGFVPLISGLSLLRLAAEAGTARRIIQDEPAGILLGLTGSALVSVGSLAAVLIFLLLAVIVIIVIFASCQRITLSVNGYLREVLPLKRMGITTDLQLGVIDEDHAYILARRIIAENRFFAGMNGTGLLMQAEAAVCIFILLACLVIPQAGNSAGQPSGIEFLNGVAPFVAGLSVFALVPALIVAVSCGVLMAKDTLALRTDNQGETATVPAKKITVVALDGDSEKGIELLTHDFARLTSSEEHIAEFEPAGSGVGAGPSSVSVDISCRNAKEYYEKLSEVICKIDSLPRVILLASDKVHSLPVTVAVNTAIRLAQKKQKVLLVDTDDARNAVAKVFDLDPALLQKKIQPSSLENLSVCCVPAEKLHLFLRKKEIFEHFRATLIYTPNVMMVKELQDGRVVKPGAFYFVEDSVPAAGQAAAEKLKFCNWLCLVPSIQSVLDSRVSSTNKKARV